MKNLMFIVFASIFAAYATPSKKLSRIDVGMTKNEVINILGEPDTVKTAEGQQVFVYQMARSENGCWSIACTSEYWVTFLGGQVTYVGKPGDFGTTIPATLRIENR